MLYVHIKLILSCQLWFHKVGTKLKLKNLVIKKIALIDMYQTEHQNT